MSAIPETKALSAEERAFLDEVKARVLQLIPGAEVIASRAQGIFEEYADWTFAVVTPTELPWQEKSQVGSAVAEIDIERGISAITQVLSRERLEQLGDTPFYTDLVHDGFTL